MVMALRKHHPEFVMRDLMTTRKNFRVVSDENEVQNGHLTLGISSTVNEHKSITDATCSW
jgi:hypothetical protein